MKITLRNMLAVCLMAPLAVFAQALPNGDMESWEPSCWEEAKNLWVGTLLT